MSGSARTHACTHTCIRAHTHMHTHAHACTHTHTCTHAYTRMNMHAHTRAHTHTQTQGESRVITLAHLLLLCSWLLSFVTVSPSSFPERQDLSVPLVPREVPEAELQGPEERSPWLAEG